MKNASSRPAAAARRWPLAAGAVAIIVVLVCLALLAGWWFMQPLAPKIDPGNAAQVALGQRVYAAQCARCHGRNLEGQPNWRERLPNGRLPAPPHDETGHTWHHPDAVLFGITRDGLGPYAPAGYESDMPAFGGVISDDDIRAALAYIKSRWPAEIQTRQAQTRRQAEQ